MEENDLGTILFIKYIKEKNYNEMLGGKKT